MTKACSGEKKFFTSYSQVLVKNLTFPTEICMHMFLCKKMIFLNDMENVSIFLLLFFIF